MTNDKPKVKMTRAEAIASLQKHCPVNDPAAIIDFYIEAGMLEVVKEEKPLVYIKFIDINDDDTQIIIKRHGKIVYDETC